LSGVEIRAGYIKIYAKEKTITPTNRLNENIVENIKMAKNRISPSKEIREKVLKEFDYRCAICGSVHPHLHHIDENPSNNEIENLIPLCPNHHLSDQHNPTSAIPCYKMKLFREYKDPTILSSKFHPLYHRLMFLYEVNENSSYEELRNNCYKLIRFISFLNMGEFYKRELSELIYSPGCSMYIGEQTERASEKEYCEKLLNNRKNAIDLIVELLRYQNWIDK
jgi:hypothetical protein